MRFSAEFQTRTVSITHERFNQLGSNRMRSSRSSGSPRAYVYAAQRLPGYLTFYPGQPQVVAQAQPFQYAWEWSEERTGALGALGLTREEETEDRTRSGGHGWTEWQRGGRQEKEEEEGELGPGAGHAKERDRASERLHHHHRWDAAFFHRCCNFVSPRSAAATQRKGTKIIKYLMNKKKI